MTTSEQHEHDFLVKLRNKAAGLIKSLIRARTVQEASFLPEAAHAHWKTQDHAKETRDCAALLNSVKRFQQNFEDEYLNRGLDSVATPIPKDNSSDHNKLIDAVANFIWGDLQKAIDDAKNRGLVDWDDLANWDKLGEIRDLLDKLPEKPTGPVCPVEIINKAEGKVRVMDEEVNLLSAQLDVIQTLVEAFPGRLSKDDLEYKSGHSGAINTLTRLINKKSSWSEVISMAKSTGGGYGLNPRK